MISLRTMELLKSLIWKVKWKSWEKEIKMLKDKEMKQQQVWGSKLESMKSWKLPGRKKIISFDLNEMIELKHLIEIKARYTVNLGKPSNPYKMKMNNLKLKWNVKVKPIQED
jgi:hypothetical protein